MKTKTFTLLLLCLWSFNLLQAQSFPVTLKIVDTSKGAKTNANDHNETNVMCWLSDDLSAQNPRNPGDWWYPMYNNSGATPDGNLVKNSNDWTWELTINATAGDYAWNPHMKSLGWATLNGNVPGVTWEGDNLSFSVSETGEITGVTEVTLDYLATIVLQIIDMTKGAKTNGEGDLAEKNVFTWAEQNNNGDWWLPLYSHPTHGTNSELIKGDDSWIWQTTIYTDNTGTFRWNPYLGDSSNNTEMVNITDFDDADWPADAKTNGLSYTVAADGTVTGTTALTIPALPSSIVNGKADNGISYKLSNNILEVSGAQNSIDLYNVAGIKMSVGTQVVDMSSFSKGVYILVIDGKYSYKLIK